MNNTLIYDISLLPNEWDFDMLQKGIKEHNTVYYDSSNHREGVKLIPPYFMNITKNNIKIKDLKDEHI